MKRQRIDEEITFVPSEERYSRIDRAIDKAKTEDDVPEKMHLIYTNKDGKVKSIEKDFLSFGDAEEWLESKGATYWEIGVQD